MARPGRVAEDGEPLAVSAGVVPGVALTLWLGLVGVACAVLVSAGAVAWWQQRRAAPEPSVWRKRPRRLRPDQVAFLLSEADALAEQASAAAAAAMGAAATMTGAQARCRSTQQARERAWHEYDTAQQAYVTALRERTASDRAWPLPYQSGSWPVLATAAPATVIPAPRRAEPPVVGMALAVPARGGHGAPSALAPSPPAPSRPAAGPFVPSRPAPIPLAAGPFVPGHGDEPVRHTDVSRAALAAYRRGDLSLEQLRVVFRRFSGWDLQQEQHEREVLRRRAAEREAHRRYDAAAAAERLVYQEVDVATAAARAWADEAADAEAEALAAREIADECLRSEARRRRPRRPSG
jgi:hypothetical protein